MLADLHRAGPRGIAQLICQNGALLERHALAEGFVDPSRVFTERYRLTWAGEQFARFLCEE